MSTQQTPVLAFLRRRKRLLIFFGVLLCLFIFKGTIYRACVSYELAEPRQRQFDYGTQLPAAPPEIEDELIEHSLDSTTDLLSFTTSPCPTNAKALRNGGSTNCIGYANLCAEIFNGLNRGEKYGLYKAETWKAHLHIFGINVHDYFESPFWKDHDVVMITSQTTGEKIILDPTLYDYTGIGIVSGAEIKKPQRR